MVAFDKSGSVSLPSISRLPALFFSFLSLLSSFLLSFFLLSFPSDLLLYTLFYILSKLSHRTTYKFAYFYSPFKHIRFHHPSVCQNQNVIYLSWIHQPTVIRRTNPRTRPIVVMDVDLWGT
ncbi:hypothetical protein QR685DRAFT_289791 [Neurospora intermedia]|uniref:Uncharacterized protein n=1 Tax=Neurospora intermedia TaxID=5142 RepID=A0ABR3DB61_NEUIN